MPAQIGICPSKAVAVALLIAATALAAVGCGFGPGEDVGVVELTVTRDYGSVPMLHRLVGDVTEADTVMRVLERNADVSTRYGGGFVQSIDGYQGSGGGGRDWFYYVNGLWAPIGAADFKLHGGEAIWWDYRDWSVGERVAAAVGAWPQPFAGGYEGSFHPTAVSCFGAGAACGVVKERLKDAGAELVAPATAGAIRVLVGPWSRIEADRDAGLLARGVGVSGAFAEFGAGGRVLLGLDEHGDVGQRFGPHAGLVAAVRWEERPPAWLITGVDVAGVASAADLLEADSLRDHYTVAVDEKGETALPLR